MTVLSIFFIVLITAFAVVAFFTEPSQTDKQIHLRLVALDRKKGSSGEEEDESGEGDRSRWQAHGSSWMSMREMPPVSP